MKESADGLQADSAWSYETGQHYSKYDYEIDLLADEGDGVCTSYENKGDGWWEWMR